MIDVVLIDDHPLIRTVIKELLETQDDIRVIGEASDGTTGFQLVSSLGPAVVIVDVNIPGVDGVTLARRLKVLMPKAVIIGISAFLKDCTHRPMLDAGAHACLDKVLLVDQLIDTVRASMGETR